MQRNCWRQKLRRARHFLFLCHNRRLLLRSPSTTYSAVAAFSAPPHSPKAQTADIIASVNGVTRSYIVPEYSFLDARGLGAYEGKKLEIVSEVGVCVRWYISPNIKPPPINDGTPNESVADIFVRVTQLMSILETQYSGDTVIIVSPDSDNLTILQAGLIGLRRHRELSFGPGEVRFVDPNDIPVYKQTASAVYKCSKNPPNCN